MNIKKTVLLLFIPVTVICTIISSCKKDKPDETAPGSSTPASATLTADSVSVNQLQIVTLTSQNISFSQSSYTGTIGGQSLTLMVYQNTLVFQVPEIAAGNYTLQTSVEGQSYTINLNVLALQAISNPDEYIQNAVTAFEYSPANLTNIASNTSTMYGASDDAANITILNSYASALQDSLASASPEKKEAFAKFIAANPALFTPREDLIQLFDSLTFRSSTVPEFSLSTFRSGLKAKLKPLILAGAAAYCANVLATTIPFGFFVAFGANCAVAYYLWEFGKYLIVSSQAALIQFDQTVIEDVQRDMMSVDFEFKKNVQYTFSISSKYRNLNQQDIGSSSSVISDIVSMFDTFENKWNSIIGFLPVKLIGSAFHIKNVSLQTKTWNVQPTYLTIQNISNPNVTAEIINTGSHLKATFHTSETTEQLFNFDIAYQNPNVNTSNTSHSAKIIIDPCIGNLVAAQSLSGKHVTASATGGTAPYQYQFSNSFGSQNFSALNTFDLVYNGEYAVVVKDANGCMDTTTGCINDVVVTEVSVIAADSINTYPGGKVKISYTSSLGLIPEFLYYTNNQYKLFFWLVTGGNSSHYASDMPQYCTSTGGSGVVPTSYTSSGTNFNRTIYYNFMNDGSHTIGNSVVQLKLADRCGGTSACTSGPYHQNVLWSQEYTLTW
jgi:hypothetical protein